jgi:hypothetical protein
MLPLTSYGKHRGKGSLGIESRCRDCTKSDYRAKVNLKKPRVYTPPKPKEALIGRHRAMLKQTADAFEAFFNEFSAEEHRMPAHVKEWVRTALDHKRLLLNVPPAHAKTTYMAEWFPIWQLACNRNSQILIVSKTVKLGEKIARKIAHELEFNTGLNHAFGRFKPVDSTRPWRVHDGELEVEGKDLGKGSGDLNVQIRGSGQQILGMRADWVIADDVTDWGIASSETEKTREWGWFLGEVMSRLAPDAHAFCIGQRVHADDLYGRLAMEAADDGDPSWDVIRTPAILDFDSKSVLWPEFWPWHKLQEARKNVGSAKFTCMYQQQPEVAGDFVPRWWIVGSGDAETPGCLDHDRGVGSGWKNQEAQFVPVTRVISIDPSPTRYAGIVVADIVYQQRATNFNCSIVDIRRGKMGLREMLSTIEELTTLHRPTVCIFESNSAKWLHEDPAWNRLVPMFLHIIAHKTTVNKRDMTMGVWSLASDFEAGRVRFPYGDREARDTSALLIDEVLAYPNGYTDDVLMALWFIKFNYKQLIPREFLPTSFNVFNGDKTSWRMPALLGGDSTWKGYG